MRENLGLLPMKFLSFFLSILCLSPGLAFAQGGDDTYQEYQLQYYPGYTQVSLFNYNVKITAEQRTSDNMVQIVAMPDQMGVQFQIQNVNFQVASADQNPSGPVAIVTGIFAIQLGYQTPSPMQKTIPVQISDVSEFSISQDEAMMQGNPVFQKQLPSMLSSQQ